MKGNAMDHKHLLDAVKEAKELSLSTHSAYSIYQADPGYLVLNGIKQGNGVDWRQGLIGLYLNGINRY